MLQGSEESTAGNVGILKELEMKEWSWAWEKVGVKVF